jgi:hypothetical protein
VKDVDVLLLEKLQQNIRESNPVIKQDPTVLCVFHADTHVCVCFTDEKVKGQTGMNSSSRQLKQMV